MALAHQSEANRVIVGSVIASFCASLPTVDYTACTKALEATAVQTHVSREADTFENQLTAYAYRKATETTSDKFIAAVGFVTKVARDKSISYPILRNPAGVRPSVNGTVGVSGGAVTFGWQL